MYRNQKKIPTVLALIILFVAIGGIIFINQSSHQLNSNAQASNIPADIHFTNTSDDAFTVSWFTASATTGMVNVEDNGKKLSYLEDADNDNIARPRTAHFVTIKNLKENSSYPVKVISGDTGCRAASNCPTFTQMTANHITANISLPAARGSIIGEDNNPAGNAIVYLTIGKSAPLSGKTDSAGLWVIPLNNLRTGDLLGRPNLSDNDIVQIVAKVATDKKTEAITDVKSIRQNLTIPPLAIGKSYNFIDLISKKDLLAGLNSTSNTLGIQTQIGSPNNILSTSTTKSIDILFPAADDDTTTDNQPRFRGIGPPGNQLIIVVNSSPQTAKVIVGADGTWVWRPPVALEPGTHYIGVTGYDKNGNYISLTRRFIVLKSGERVLGEATASATLTPTVNISATPTLVLVPSPTVTLVPVASPTGNPTIPVGTASATSVIPPKTGSTDKTFLLLGAGGSLLLLGLKLILF